MGKIGNTGAWLLDAVLRPAWRCFLEDARVAPADAWKRWSMTLLLGYLAAGGAAVLATLVARDWLEQGLQAWDERVLAIIAESAFSFATGLWFEAWGSSAFLVPMLLIVVVLLALGRRPFGAATLVAAYVLNKGLVLGTWQLWDRARPEVIAEGIAAPGLHSFPSGHAVNAVVLFGLVGAMWWRASESPAERVANVLIMAAVVLLTCLGRVRLGTHWPSDIVAGVIIGSVWLVGLVLAMVTAERAAAELMRPARRPRRGSAGSTGTRPR